MVEAVIVTEEECKEVPSCTWRATDPTDHSYIAPQLSACMHRKPAMLKPFLPVYGTSTSYSVRDGLLPVHPLVLHSLPATLRASTLMTKMRCNELVKRPSNDVSLLLTTPAASLASRPSRASSDRTSHLRRPAAVARSPTPPVEETTMKPARKAISTLRGEGTWGTTGGREQVWGQRLGRLLTILPWFPLTPNLACTNEETPRGESPEATRPDSRGQTARVRTPHGETPRTRTRTRTRSRTEMPATRPRRRGHEHTGDFPAMFLDLGAGDVPRNMNGKSCFPHDFRG